MYQNITPVLWTSVSEYSGISTGNGKAYSSPTIQAESAFLPWDNPDNIITLEQYEFTSTILYCALTPILLLVGVPANIISCLVFYKQGLRDRMNLCLFVLALVDTVYLASYSVSGYHSFIRFWDEELGRKYLANIVVYLTPIVFGLRAASGCITMVVAVERCVCVVFPLRANSIMRTRTMGALLAAIVIVMVLGFSFTIFRIKVEMVYDTTLGIKTHKVTMNEDFEKYDFILWDIVYTFIFGFLVPVVTFVVVGVATAITVIKLRTAIAWRASTSSGRGDNQNQQQQVALTKTLVILSCVFMACTTPFTSLSILRLLLPDFTAFGRYSNFFLAAYETCSFLSTINSSVNFFVYYTRSSRFRVGLHTLGRCCYTSALKLQYAR